MGAQTDQALWNLARKQHGVVARRQLLALGFTPKAIVCGVEAGRLHRTEWRGVYVVGRPDLTRHARSMAAVLWAGPGAMLSHESAGDLWGIRKYRGREIHLSLPAVRKPRSRRGVVVHRRTRLKVTRHWGIPITTPLLTVIDLAAGSDRDEAERLINNADARNVLRADTLREQLEHETGPGVPLLREILDRDAFVLTDTELERLFPPLAARAGLPKPETQVHVNGQRVDFYFAEYDLVVEADSLRYHRTQLQQRKDSLRLQAHAAAGTAAVPFLHFQIAREQDYVVETLRRTASSRSARRAAGSPSPGRSSGCRPRSSASP
jgi:very-short-patch-repair endonuclease